ncbi:MAG: SDR family oxidoreductase [Propionibacteriaceae bacterium]
MIDSRSVAIAGGAVDAHHHLWDPSDPGQGWLADPALAAIRRRFDLQDLHEAVHAGVAGRPVTATVLVQSVARTDESVRLLTTAANDDLVAAVVGWVDLTADVPAQLDRLRTGNGGRLLRGVRHLVQDEPDPQWLLRDDVMAGLQALGNADLPYDVLVRPPQLPAAVELSQRLPSLRLVLDHAGKPPLASGDLEGWAHDVRALARSEQVVCKVSGLITEADHQRWSIADLRPALDTVLDAFGPHRLLFGSDWPVCLLAASWERWATTIAEFIAPLSPDEADALLRTTASVTYGLDPPVNADLDQSRPGGGPGVTTIPASVTSTSGGSAEFDGVRALVTGGASGIGRATARALRVRGAAVASLDLRPLTEPEEDILEIACDVGNDASVREAIAEVAGRLSGLDVVVSNAGIGSTGGVEDVRDEEWQHILNINVVGTARLVRAALPHLRQSAPTGRAAVVCTGSIAAWTGLVQRAAYSASKGALHALVLAMAADLVREGIRVNAVAPGTADTPWVQRLLSAAPDPDAALTALRARQPTGRLVTAEEVAHAVCYLASPLAGATTGTILQVDGGSHSLVLPPAQ